tara:strand:- start:1462 stop:1725 length:264 start_codon:yes stop_codon:yes gene_type:complete
MSLKERFPESLRRLGLNYGFTDLEFRVAMSFLRSDELRQLAHREWESEQDPLYDNSNWRWYLSYVSMKNEYTTDLYYNLNLENSLEP